MICLASQLFENTFFNTPESIPQICDPLSQLVPAGTRKRPVVASSFVRMKWDPRFSTAISALYLEMPMKAGAFVWLEELTSMSLRRSGVRVDESGESYNPKHSMYGIFTYIWVVFGVNVAKYTIH